MINDDIISIKDSILNTVGDDCEKIILFGSYAYGTPREDSDYDFYVVLKDGTEHPILVMQKIYECMCDTKYKPVDVLANYKSMFERISAQPTLDRTIADKGVVLYERKLREWLRYAHNDLIVTKHCFEAFNPKQTEISAYHASNARKSP
ncbi:hypothetical protein PilKf_00870 [Pillotina sp. SPG140]|jgi:predicted nucleotidyltransferase